MLKDFNLRPSLSNCNVGIAAAAAREETSLFMRPFPVDVGQFRLKIYDTLPIFSTGIVCFATTMHTFLTAPQLKIPSKRCANRFFSHKNSNGRGLSQCTISLAHSTISLLGR